MKRWTKQAWVLKFYKGGMYFVYYTMKLMLLQRVNEVRVFCNVGLTNDVHEAKRGHNSIKQKYK